MAENSIINFLTLDKRTNICGYELTETQRQTVVSQFFQLDRLVVEGGKSVGSIQYHIAVWDSKLTKHQGKQGGRRNDIVRQKDTG